MLIKLIKLMAGRLRHQSGRTESNILSRPGFHTVLFMLSGFIFLGYAQAETAPILVLKMSASGKEGHIEDGKRVGEGHISYRENHTGLKVWSEAPRTGTEPDRYTIIGIKNSMHKLKIRLKGDGWEPDSNKGQGIIIYTEDDVARFYMVADGDQSIEPDSYPFQVKGTALLP